MEKDEYIRKSNDIIIPGFVQSLSYDLDGRYKKNCLPGEDVVYTYIDMEGNKCRIASHFIENKNFSILNDEKDYINGFRRVLFSDFTYGYREESTEELVPYKFNLATNFNENGIAMVAIDSGVTLLTSDFKILYKNGKYFKMGGFSSHFSMPIPIKVDSFSSLYITYTHRASNGINELEAMFLDKTGSNITFRSPTGEGERLFFRKTCKETLLKENECRISEAGFIICGDYILLSSGYYITLSELCMLPEVIDYIRELSMTINSQHKEKRFIIETKKREGE